MGSYGDILTELKAKGNFRTIPACGGSREVVDFSTNDYLGIASDSSLLDEFMATADARCALTSSASRLLASDQRQYSLLEQTLSSLYRRPALLFNSGYHANTGLVSALASLPRTMVLADRLVHASIIDGITLSRARFARFRHNDYDHLEALIERHSADCDRLLVVVESVYSMDGDRCDIARLAAIKERHPRVMLYVDEAHAFGVLGPGGLGLVKASPAGEAVDVVVGTLGKAAASVGAFAIMDPELRDFAVNTARSLIFSTALPPLNCAWSRFIIERLADMEPRRQRLMELASKLTPLSADGTTNDKYIFPYIIGDAGSTVALSAKLLEHGLKVLPIRTPTVPSGTERLRISLSASIPADEVDRLVETLKNTVAP